MGCGPSVKGTPQGRHPPTHTAYTYTNTYSTYTQEGTRQQWMSLNRELQEEKTNAPCPAAGESLEVCVGIVGGGCVCVCVAKLTRQLSVVSNFSCYRTF